ncbi:uncharacterized protein LOC109722710 isoform X2 [Ananas comosus]|uniref:Uncharacterized protein LOC109722710 isoform X2 n=1 Tax=Ananas comosus TaxID=4615 RepID=A0A6P5GEL5_ANACO|nr:uncharacterized protein LOC109722710 isoform X2 [Ananas comosus]
MLPGELENGSFNGSFLILNLGNNTVGLGNPCMFPIPPKSLHQRSIDGAHDNSISIGNTNASSNIPTEESPRGSSEHKRNKMLSDESDDPDWVPGMRARKRSSSLALRAAKPNALSPPVGSNNSDISQRGFNGTTASGTGQPPQYLVGLLNFFGWKVLFRPGFDDYVYISPAGITFYSLPKAFETFLLGTSKYKEKLPVTSVGEFPLRSADNGKRLHETKRTSSVVGEGAAASMSIECVNLTQFSQKPDKVVENTRTCTEDNKAKKIAASSCLIANEAKTCNDDAHDERRNCKFRRSVRITRGDIIGASSVDAAQTKAASCRTKRDAVGDIVSEYPNNKVRKSNCRDIVVLETDRRNQKCVSNKKKLARVWRSRRGNRKRVPVDAEFNAENMVHDNLASSTSVDNNAVSGNFCANDKGSSGGDKKLGSSNITVSCQSIFSDDCAIAGTRKSMRINGKHVPVNNELECEMGADDGIFEHFKSATSRVAKKDKQELATSAEDDEMDVSTHVSDDMQFKHSDAKNFDCQNSKPHRQLESHDSKKNHNNEKIPISEMSSAKSRKTVVKESLISEKKKGNRACRLILRRKGKDDRNNRSPLETKYTMLSWLIDAGALTENEKVMYVSKSNTTNILSGLVTRVGICCDCCKEVMSLLKFEAHAGSNLQQPWSNIFLMSGKTLLQCLKEAWDQKKMESQTGVETVGIDDLDPSDDTCGVCADGGHLICCDGCPSTFHQECLMLKVLPEGCWYCPYCRCAICTASEYGLYGVPETLKLLICKQCGRKYHRKCSSGNDTLEMGLFCGEKCKKLANQLSNVIGVTNHMEGGFSWSLLQIFGEDEAVCSNYRMPFILECNAKLAMALSVLNECFLPLIDRRTGMDMIGQAVFSRGSRFDRLNFQGFYTVVLEKDGEIISVASLRFRGTNFAEMPFVGTRPIYQRQGMCHRLLRAVEQMLSSLHVEKLVIPAIPDLVETWTRSFSFKPLESALKDEIKNLSLVVFAETTMLEKRICSAAAAQEEGDLQTNEICSSATGAEEAKEQPGFCGTGWWTLSFTAANDAQHNSSVAHIDSIYCALSFDDLIKIRD